MKPHNKFYTTAHGRAMTMDQLEFANQWRHFQSEIRGFLIYPKKIRGVIIIIIINHLLKERPICHWTEENFLRWSESFIWIPSLILENLVT